MLTLCVFPIYITPCIMYDCREGHGVIYITPSLTACIMYDCREGHGVIYIGNTQSVSISFLFLFFFHQSSLYPIKIFAKCFYLLVIIMHALFVFTYISLSETQYVMWVISVIQNLQNGMFFRMQFHQQV